MERFVLAYPLYSSLCFYVSCHQRLYLHHTDTCFFHDIKITACKPSWWAKSDTLNYAWKKNRSCQWRWYYMSSVVDPQYISIVLWIQFRTSFVTLLKTPDVLLDITRDVVFTRTVTLLSSLCLQCLNSFSDYFFCHFFFIFLIYPADAIIPTWTKQHRPSLGGFHHLVFLFLIDLLLSFLVFT